MNHESPEMATEYTCERKILGYTVFGFELRLMFTHVLGSLILGCLAAGCLVSSMMLFVEAYFGHSGMFGSLAACKLVATVLAGMAAMFAMATSAAFGAFCGAIEEIKNGNEQADAADDA